MPERAQLRVFEETTAALPVTKPWERQDAEPARWFLRFRNYLKLGSRRSVNAVFERERQEKAGGKATNKAGSRWYDAARYWRWEARAQAWDAEGERQKAEAMRATAASMPFVSKPYRLVQLNALASLLMRKVEEEKMEVPDLLACVRLVQSVMHDIEASVGTLGYDIDGAADSAALLTLAKKFLRIEDLV